MKPFVVIYMSEETNFNWKVHEDWFESQTAAESFARAWKAKHPVCSNAVVSKVVSEV